MSDPDELDMYLFALSIGQQLNAIADAFENEAEIVRKESRWNCQADADDFDCRR